MSKQETDLVLYRPDRIEKLSFDCFEAECVPVEIPLMVAGGGGENGNSLDVALH